MPPRRSTSSMSRMRRRSSPRTARPSGSTTMPHSAKERGLKLIIAGAGGAAHLPGMTASMTALPVLGVPVESQALKGMDSLLSIVQMPAGVPVGTLAIGKAGAINAGAARRRDARDQRRGARGAARAWREDANRIGRRSARMIVPPGSTIGIIGGGQLGRMLAIAAAQLGYKCHIFDPHERPCAADVAAHFTRADFDDVAALERFGASGRRRDLRVREPAGRAARSRSATSCGRAPARSPSRRTARARSSSSRTAARRSRRGAQSSSLDDVALAVAELGLPLVLKTRRYGYDGKGQAWIRSAARRRSSVGGDRRASPQSPRPASTSPPNSRSSSRAGPTAATPSGIRPDNEHGEGHPSPLDRPVQRRRRGPDRRSARSGAAHRRGARPRRRAHRRILRQRDGPASSTRSRRASTTAATGRSRARSPRSSSSTSARSAAFRPGSTELVGAGATMDNLIGDEIDRWPELVADPRRPRPHLWQGRGAPGRKMGHVTRVCR